MQEELVNNEEILKKDKNGMYTTGSIYSPYYFATAICSLYNNKFSSEWLPLEDVAINARIMNWAQILSKNLATTILEYRREGSIASRVYPTFFISTYVVDAICFVSKFLVMGWKRMVQNPLPIQIYHKFMWESIFVPHLFKICHGVVLLIH